MKTSFKKCHWVPVVILMMLLLIAPAAFPQQVIKLKNGQELNVIIKYMSRDTVKYQLVTETGITRMVLAEQVDTILGYIPDLRSVTEAAPAGAKKEKMTPEELKYTDLKKTGRFLMIGGGIFGGIGIIVTGTAMSTKDFYGMQVVSDVNESQAILGLVMTAVGLTGLVTGTIVNGIGSSKMKELKKKAKGLTFDLNFTPGQKRISLKYNF